ncbi:MAG: 3-dehydroquinate synthase [Planctomycetota bacterium]|nr:3-dehydroquinate synthase [Planctomycetota bacterium]
MASTPPPVVELNQDVTRLEVDGTFSVSWTHRLRFTRDVLAKNNPVLAAVLPSKRKPTRVLTVLDEGLVTARPGMLDQVGDWLEHQSERLEPVAPPLILPGGEDAKTGWSAYELTSRAIAEGRICRQSVVLIFGGGAVLDAVGFAAATSHRGVGVIRLPSTTLSQGDSGIGVKNAINAFGMKNFLGTFSPPLAVVNDTKLLDSLDESHWRGGLSEAVKVAVLKDSDLLQIIEQDTNLLLDRDLDAMERILMESARLHMDHIVHGGDPFETKHARPLDLGHWSAHRMEALSNWTIPHGDAVALGLAIDLVYAVKIGRLKSTISDRLLQCLHTLGFLSYTPVLEDVDALLTGIEEFREHLGGQLAIPMITDIGVPDEVHEIDLKTMRTSIESVRDSCQPA